MEMSTAPGFAVCHTFSFDSVIKFLKPFSECSNIGVVYCDISIRNFFFYEVGMLGGVHTANPGAVLISISFSIP
ncbi:hypothetical protein ES703_93995 [subsurface metagenome]